MPSFTVSHWWQVQVWRAWVGAGCWCSQRSARLPCVGGCSFLEPAACLQHRAAHGQEEAVSSSSLFSSTTVSSPDAQREQLPVHSRCSRLPEPLSTARALLLTFFIRTNPPCMDSTWVQEKIYLLWNCTLWCTSMTFSTSILNCL